MVHKKLSTLFLCWMLTGIAGQHMAVAQHHYTNSYKQSLSEADTLKENKRPYLLPDVTASKLIADGKQFWIKPIIAIVLDYTSFWQDQPSLDQVGEQENTADVRAARIGFNLRSKRKVKWVFTFTADYQEARTRDDATFQIYDLKLDVPLGPVMLTLGKQKEPFSYEMVGLMPVLPQQERILNPFFVTRNTGIQFSGQLANDRMTWWAGAFNDWLETSDSFTKNATNFAGRLTGLAYVTDDNLSFLHLGIGGRHAGSDNGTMRFSGRPSSNVADKYLDTKSFTADNATAFSLEAVYSFKPVLLQAEYIQTRVNVPSGTTPNFWGTYFSASWVITGESRPYNRKLGYAMAIVPEKRYGAFELVGRYGYVDLVDSTIDGGMLSHWYYGVNWWASRQWKVGVSYGHADLDRDALAGNTKMLLWRLLWMF